MLNITLNTEKNGIELRFNSKPSAEILTKIKENGYRWSNNQKIWYAKQSENAMTIANEIAETIGTFTPAEKSKQEKLQSYDLGRLLAQKILKIILKNIIFTIIKKLQRESVSI